MKASGLYRCFTVRTMIHRQYVDGSRGSTRQFVLFTEDDTAPDSKNSMLWVVNPEQLAAREASRKAYIEGLSKLSEDELLLEFRFRDSMPDFRPQIEAEVRRRKLDPAARPKRTPA